MHDNFISGLPRHAPDVLNKYLKGNYQLGVEVSGWLHKISRFIKGTIKIEINRCPKGEVLGVKNIINNHFQGAIAPEGY